MKVIVAPGRRVRHPDTAIPITGEIDVDPNETHWWRLLSDGDLVEVVEAAGLTVTQHEASPAEPATALSEEHDHE